MYALREMGTADSQPPGQPLAAGTSAGAEWAQQGTRATQPRGTTGWCRVNLPAGFRQAEPRLERGPGALRVPKATGLQRPLDSPGCFPDQRRSRPAPAKGRVLLPPPRSRKVCWQGARHSPVGEAETRHRFRRCPGHPPTRDKEPRADAQPWVALAVHAAGSPGLAALRGANRPHSRDALGAWGRGRNGPRTTAAAARRASSTGRCHPIRLRRAGSARPALRQHRSPGPSPRMDCGGQRGAGGWRPSHGPLRPRDLGRRAGGAARRDEAGRWGSLVPARGLQALAVHAVGGVWPG